MTNTLNTPVEALEMSYPIRINQYSLRESSAGKGQYNGGEGLIREYEFLSPTHITLLTERRSNQPWGINEAEPGACGKNILNGEELPAKVSMNVSPGGCLMIKTPGGGGFNR